MTRRRPDPTPWERTCPGFRRAIAESVATGEMPGWVARHLDRCPPCRRGLAHVVASCTPLSEAGRGLAEQVAFVAKVRGLARDIVQERRRSVIQHVTRRRLDRFRRHLQADWRVPAALALVLAVASAALAFWLIVTGPTGHTASSPVAPPIPEAARISAPQIRR